MIKENRLMNKNKQPGCFSFIFNFYVLPVIAMFFLFFYIGGLLTDQNTRNWTIVFLCIVGAIALMSGLIALFNWIDKKKKEK